MADHPSKILDASTLLFRLTEGLRDPSRKVVFLFGSALTMPEINGAIGVPTTEGIIQMVEHEFVNSPDQLEQLRLELTSPDINRYQIALEFLNVRFGQDAINSLVKRAVWASRKPISEDEQTVYVPGAKTDDETCELAEKDPAQWHVNSGLRALAQLVNSVPQIFGSTILTSNFDPLIEVALRSVGAPCYTTVLHGDGNLKQTRGDGTHVVHFHGYWYGSDTLHTPRQLLQPRPRLQASLRQILQGAILVVIGYGGWDDIFAQALADVAADDNASPEVLWTLHGNNGDLDHRLKRLLSPGIGRGRINIFTGISCAPFLISLSNSWIALDGAESRPNNSAPSLPMIDRNPIKEVTTSDQTDSTHFQEITLPGVSNPDFKIKLYRFTRKIFGRRRAEIYVPDNPPVPDVWVGREAELRILMKSTEPIVIITGIGGEGKSLLASTYLTRATESDSKFTFWDWRDCKEERNRFHSQLIYLIQRLTEGFIDPELLADNTLHSIVKLFLQYLPEKRSLFVFDNIDSYIDLDNLEFTSGPKILFDSVISSQVNCQIVFTCRPRIVYDTPMALILPLTGFSYQETSELFDKRNCDPGDVGQIDRAHQLTKGHAFWLDLLATQAARKLPGVTLKGLLDDIEADRAPIPRRTLQSIWGSLRDEERIILRTMAEAVRPTKESAIFKYVSDRMINYNRFSRALRSLS